MRIFALVLGEGYADGLAAECWRAQRCLALHAELHVVALAHPVVVAALPSVAAVLHDVAAPGLEGGIGGHVLPHAVVVAGGALCPVEGAHHEGRAQVVAGEVAEPHVEGWGEEEPLIGVVAEVHLHGLCRQPAFVDEGGGELLILPVVPGQLVVEAQVVDVPAGGTVDGEVSALEVVAAGMAVGDGQVGIAVEGKTGLGSIGGVGHYDLVGRIAREGAYVGKSAEVLVLPVAVYRLRRHVECSVVPRAVVVAGALRR